METKTVAEKREKTLRDPNYTVIVVEAKRAGDFGYVSISGIRHEDDKHLQEMMKDIKRHVNGVASVYLQGGWICSECEHDYDSRVTADKCCTEEEI